VATLVDANVLLDVVTADPAWAVWSAAAMTRAAAQSRLITTPVVYAELSIGFAAMATLERFLNEAGIVVVEPDRHALFQAGKAFLAYRRRGGERTGVLPDFFIGAQAAAGGHVLLTRDPRRYRTYFPTVRLIAPETA
jgi:hypothetical protein